MYTEGSHPHHTKLLSPGLGDALLLAFDKLAHRLLSSQAPQRPPAFSKWTFHSCYYPSL